MQEQDLENIYREHLEENIILELSKKRKISLEDAMNLFYESSLSKEIAKGEYGIQYLDSSILADLIK